MRFSSSIFVSSAFALFVVIFSGHSTFAQGTGSEPRLILKGYDPVAYFTEQKPVRGTREFQLDFDGARYHFASVRNRSSFNADPDRYVPQFSGLCTAGLSMNKKVDADPTLWKIVDGKLYVFSSAKALEKVEQDPSLLTRAHQNSKAQK